MDNSFCCVPQCNSLGSRMPRTSFHRFPSVKENNGIRRLQWIAKLRIGKEVSHRMVVCGKHFKESDFFLATVGVNGLKRRNLKRNAVPSLNLPVSPEDETDDYKRYRPIKRLKINNKVPITEGMTPEVRKFLTLIRKQDHGLKENSSLPITQPKTSSTALKNQAENWKSQDRAESTGDQEEIKNGTSSSSVNEIHEEHKVTLPCITRLSAVAPNNSDSDTNTTKHTSENLENPTEICPVSLSPRKCKENSKFDCSMLNALPDDSKETLTKKLESVKAINTLLQKKITFYQNKCEMYEREVNIMKGVIENLKQINSATFDN